MLDAAELRKRAESKNRIFRSATVLKLLDEIDALKQQLDIATDLGQKRFEENAELRTQLNWSIENSNSQLEKIHITNAELTEKLKAAEDAEQTIRYIAKYDGSDNNRRSWQEEFTFIRVKAMDCVRRLASVQEPNSPEVEK